MVDSIGAAAATSGPADPSQVQQAIPEPAADAQTAPPAEAVTIPPAGEDPPPKPDTPDEKRWLERDDVIRRVARARAAQIEASNAGEPEPTGEPSEPVPVEPPPPPAPATPAAEPVPIAAAAPPADTVLTVKIDDEEFQVSRDKVRDALGPDAGDMPDGLLVKNFQILAASQKRLAEARFIKRQAMEAPAPAAPAAPEPTPPPAPTTPDVDREALRKAVERIQLGTVDEGVDAFLSVMDNVRKDRNTIDPQEVARIASETARRQAAVSDWERDNKDQLRVVAEKNRDVWSDAKLQPNLANRAAQLMTMDLQRLGYTADQLGPLSPEQIGETHARLRFARKARQIGEIFDQAAQDIRADFPERFTAPAPAPTATPLATAPPSLAAKQQAKEAMPPAPIPAARAHALPQQPKRKTPTEIVNDMRKARQLPGYSAA